MKARTYIKKYAPHMLDQWDLEAIIRLMNDYKGYEIKRIRRKESKTKYKQLNLFDNNE